MNSLSDRERASILHNRSKFNRMVRLATREAEVYQDVRCKHLKKLKNGTRVIAPLLLDGVKVVLKDEASNAKDRFVALQVCQLLSSSSKKLYCSITLS